MSNGNDYIEILEKHLHILFKFMVLCPRRSESYKSNVKNLQRENDFMFQRKFVEAKKQGRTWDPEQWWLEHLTYLLESTHEKLVSDASNNTKGTSAATYKCFVENYSLQIWKAAPGHEFLVNEKLIDFEGDTQSYLGTEETSSDHHLIWMTTDTMNHMVLPISPDVAIIFCNESLCWSSPFTATMHRPKIPYPENSLLVKAPHKDIILVGKPKEKRGKKNWPATTAWRVSIGTLDPSHHRIVTSYSLAHAESLLVSRTPELFEKAEKDLKTSSTERQESWKNCGFRFHGQDGEQRRLNPIISNTSTDNESRDFRVLDNYLDALVETLGQLQAKQEPLLRNKANVLR